MVRQIIAMGGGGFSMEPENPLLDQYVLEQANQAKPSICFMGTASGDAEGYIESFYTAFGKLNCQPSHLSLSRPTIADVESFILAQNIIYVGGGNTRNMLTLWKERGIDRILRAAWEQGVILTGLSAGAICWFEAGVSDSNAGGLSSLPGLGLLPGSNCPHYDGETERRDGYHALLRSGDIGDGWALDDGVALHYHGESIHTIVSSRPHANAYQLRYNSNTEEVHEMMVEPEFLGTRI